MLLIARARFGIIIMETTKRLVLPLLLLFLLKIIALYQPTTPSRVLVCSLLTEKAVYYAIWIKHATKATLPCFTTCHIYGRVSTPQT